VEQRQYLLNLQNTKLGADANTLKHRVRIQNVLQKEKTVQSK